MTTPRRQRKARTEGGGQPAITQEQPLQVPGRWVGTEEVPILMANHIFVRYINGQVVIAFGQAVPPYELQISKETLARLQREGAPIRAVAQVSVSPFTFAQIVRVLNDFQGKMPELVARDTNIGAEVKS